MSNDKLASTIDDAFEARDKIGPKTKGAVRKAVNAALELLDSGKARVAERKADGHWQVNQWLKKAVLLSFRLNDMSVIPGGPGKARVVGQGRFQIQGLECGALPQGGLPRRSRLRGSPLGLHRARRRADAVLRQPRRLCRFRHHDRHLGDGRKLRADRQELPHLRRRRHRRRAGAAAGRAGHHRGQLLRRRALRSGRGRHRAHRRGAVDGRLSRRLDPHRRPRDRARSRKAKCRPTPSSCQARCPGKAAARASTAP